MTKTALILAGGQGRRMGGQDKGEIKLSGDRLIDRVLERLTPQVERIIISGAHDYGTELEVLPDNEFGPRGPSAGLFAMIQKYPEMEGFLTVPVDSPFFPSELYGRLSSNGSAIAAGPERAHPVFAYWTMSDLKTVFADSPDKNRALHKIAEQVDARTETFRAESYFINFNSPGDLTPEFYS